jgi:hypothetical protein
MRRMHALAAITLFLSTALAIWWLVGDLSTVDPSRVEADYVMRPVGLSAEPERMIGITASLLAVGMASVLGAATIRGSVAPRWLLAVLPLLLVAAFCGLAYRAGTAAVIGANMMWGMVLLAGPPFLCAMLLTSSRQWKKAQETRVEQGQ